LQLTVAPVPAAVTGGELPAEIPELVTSGAAGDKQVIESKYECARLRDTGRLWVGERSTIAAESAVSAPFRPWWPEVPRTLQPCGPGPFYAERNAGADGRFCE